MLKEDVLASFDNIIKLMAEVDYDAVKKGYSFNFRDLDDVQRLRITNPDKFKMLLNLYKKYFNSFRRYITNIEDQQKLFLDQLVKRETVDKDHVKTVRDAAEDAYNQVDNKRLEIEELAKDYTRGNLDNRDVQSINYDLNKFIDRTESLLDQLEDTIIDDPMSLDKIEDKAVVVSSLNRYISIMKLSQKLLPHL